MKLGEVIKKRDYFKRCLLDTTTLIMQASFASDKFSVSDNSKRLKELSERLADDYSSYQNYNLIVARAEANTMIPLEDGSEVSIRDAAAVREALELRYNCFKDILKNLIEKKESGNMVCIDVDELSNILLSFHDEVMGIDIKIEEALWSSEVQ